MIPKAAQPIADYIRENVSRPVFLPTPHRSGCCLSWEGGTYGTCPMGLLDEAEHPLPKTIYDFHPNMFTNDGIKYFYTWWDSQTDPQAAINAIKQALQQKDKAHE